MALLWILYPVGALVFLELLLRAINGDDDDDDQGGGVMTPIFQGAEHDLSISIRMCGSIHIY